MIIRMQSRNGNLRSIALPWGQVLNVAGNKLVGTLRVKGVPKLRALIANDNDITAVKGQRAWQSARTLHPESQVHQTRCTACVKSGRPEGCTCGAKLAIGRTEMKRWGWGGEAQVLVGCLS